VSMLYCRIDIAVTVCWHPTCCKRCCKCCMHCKSMWRVYNRRRPDDLRQVGCIWCGLRPLSQSYRQGHVAPLVVCQRHPLHQVRLTQQHASTRIATSGLGNLGL
jgi:hypothetical protein